MAYYGTSLNTAFKFHVNSPYSQAIGDSKTSSLANEALGKVLYDIAKNGMLPYTTDLLRSCIKVASPQTVVANAIDLSAIADYNHLMDGGVRVTSQDDLFRATLTNILLVDGIFTRIVLSRASKLRSTEQVVLTNSPCNGTYYVKQLSATVYELYTNINLTVPFYNGVPYANAGTVKRLVSAYATEENTSKKSSVLTAPTTDFPKYQFSDNTLLIYPGVGTIVAAEMDYITLPPLTIDVTDSTDDLLEFYSPDLLDKVVDKMSYLFGAITGYTQLAQIEAGEIQMNNKENPQ